MTPSLEQFMNELADLHQAIADHLRSYAAPGAVTPESPASDASWEDRVIAAARRMHNSIGPRQVEALRLVVQAHPKGATTGPMVKAMKYDQPNVYLTLQSLMRHKLVIKDSDSTPHRYYLSKELRREAGEAT